MKRALVLSLAVIFGLGIAGMAQTLSGEWDTTIDIGLSPLSIDINSTLTVTYEVAGWAFTSDTAFGSTGWTGQSFSADGSLGAFSLGSVLKFNPLVPEFTSWEVTAGVSIAGVTFGMDFTLVPDNVTLVLSGSGQAGLVSIDVDVTFGNSENEECDLDWSGVAITVGFPFCCADVELTLALDCDGFDKACFGVTDILVPALPWLTFDAEVCFELQTKTLNLTPSFDFGDVVCFELYFDVDFDTDGPGFSFGDITVEGIGLSCDIGGVEFYGLSYWGDGDKPGPLYGTTYWEVYQISTTDDGCCGPFDFDIAVFFSDEHLSLFDIAEFDANMSIQLASQFTFSMGIDYVVGTGYTTWSLGFNVTW